jgi:hypothetical protein
LVSIIAFYPQNDSANATGKSQTPVIHAEAGDVEATRAKAALVKNRERRAEAVREAARTLASKKKEVVGWRSKFIAWRSRRHCSTGWKR